MTEKQSTPAERRGAAELWLRLAREDLDVAGSSLGRLGRHRAFWAQQAAEKAIKSLLVLNNVDPPKIHDLHELTSLVPADWGFSWDVTELRSLSQWAVDTRYPPFADDIDPEEAAIGVAVAAAIVARVTEVIRTRQPSAD